MSDPNEQQPSLPSTGFSLGGLGPDDYDTSLRQPAEPGEPAPTDDRLILPRDALVAFRKSGGMRFSSRAIVVYRNGWVVPTDGSQARPRHMNDEAFALLSRLVLRSGLARVEQAATSQPPDRYAYEIVARVGRNTRAVEVVDGAIPASLAVLISVLTRLLPN